MTAADAAPNCRVLAIGLDSIDPDLLQRWCDAGDLPVLRRLRDRGMHGRLAGPPCVGDDGAWARR